jgi:hypothetical protein
MDVMTLERRMTLLTNSTINKNTLGGIGVIRASGHKTSASTPVYATSPVVRQREIWLSDISGKPSNPYYSAEK